MRLIALDEEHGDLRDGDYLTVRQADGLACVWCAGEHRAAGVGMVQVGRVVLKIAGHRLVPGSQLFAHPDCWTYACDQGEVDRYYPPTS